jgi:hypothetical protein
MSAPNLHSIPGWEAIRPLQDANGYNPEWASCTCSDHEGTIFHLASSATGSRIWAYNTANDEWFQLTDLAVPSVHHSGASDAAIVGGAAMVYKEHGYYSRAIAGGSSWIQGAFFGLRGPCDVGIRIVSGTGAGQERRVVSVDAAVEADSVGVDLANSTVDYVKDNGGSRGWTDNQFAGYQLRAVTSSNAGIIGAIRPIIQNSGSYIYNERPPASGMRGRWAYPLGVGLWPTSFADRDPAVIESSVARIDTPWAVAPDRTSVFELLSGSLYILTMPNATVDFAFTQYCLLSNSFRVLHNPTAFFYQYDYTGCNHVTLEGIDSSMLPDRLVEGTATGGSAAGLLDSSKSLPVNRYVNSRVYLTGGPGAGQQRTIGANGAQSLTVNVPWATPPGAGTTYYVGADSDKLYMMALNNCKVLQYSVELDQWTPCRVIDAGVACSMAARTSRMTYPLTALSRTGTAASGSFNNTAHEGDFLVGDPVRIQGASDPLWNLSTTISIDSMSSVKYDVAGDPASPASPAVNHQQIYYRYVTVTGAASPDCSGTYEFRGTFNGRPYYQRTDNANFYLWWMSSGYWYISGTVGDGTPWSWFRGYEDPAGAFTASGSATGAPTLAALTWPVPYYSEIIVTGATTPNVGGVYVFTGIYNGVPYWRCGSYYLWMSIVNTYWYITDGPPVATWVPTAYPVVRFAGPNNDRNPYSIPTYWAVGSGSTGSPVLTNVVPQTFFNSITVSGTNYAAANGVYAYDGMYDGFPSYKKSGSELYIWRGAGASFWCLTAAKGSGSTPGWANGGYVITGSYSSGTQTACALAWDYDSGIAYRTPIQDSVIQMIQQYPTLVDCTKSWTPGALVGKVVVVPSQPGETANSGRLGMYVITGNTETSISANFKETITNASGRYVIMEPFMFGTGPTALPYLDECGTVDFSTTADAYTSVSFSDNSKNWRVNEYPPMRMSPVAGRDFGTGPAFEGTVLSSTAAGVSSAWYTNVNRLPPGCVYSVSRMAAPLNFGQVLIWAHDATGEDSRFRYMYLTPSPNSTNGPAGLQRYDLRTESWDRFYSFMNPKYINGKYMMAAYGGGDEIYVLDNSASAPFIYVLDVGLGRLSASYSLPGGSLWSSYSQLPPGNRMEVVPGGSYRYLYLPMIWSATSAGGGWMTWLNAKRLQLP